MNDGFEFYDYSSMEYPKETYRQDGVLFGVWRRERGDPKRFHFNCISDLVRFVTMDEYFRANAFVFRGQTHPWVLRASAYRPGAATTDTAKKLVDWLLNKRRMELAAEIPEVAELLQLGFAKGFDTPVNVFSSPKFELSNIAFAIAQHFGFPTSLMDWTHQVEVAAYFATQGDFDPLQDTGVVFAINLNDLRSPDDTFPIDLNNSAIGFRRIEFKGVKRITAQAGIFCIDPNLRKEIATRMPWFDLVTHMTFNHSEPYRSERANESILFPDGCRVARLICEYRNIAI